MLGAAAKVKRDRNDCEDKSVFNIKKNIWRELYIWIEKFQEQSFADFTGKHLRNLGNFLEQLF